MNPLYLRQFLLIAIAMLCGQALAGPGITEDTITFGQIVALEGPASAIGREIQTGIRAAFEETNRAGGVKGRKLVLLSEDDAYDPPKSLELANKMASSGEIFALIGSMGTPTSAVIAPIASGAGIPFLMPFTGAQFLREPFDPNVVNIRPSYAHEVEVLTERLIKDKGVSRIALFYQDDSMGQTASAGFYRALARAGKEPAAEGSFERNTVAVKSALLKIQRGRPEAVILIGTYKPCAEFIKLARELKLNAYMAMGAYAGGGALLEEAGPAAPGVIVLQVVPPPDDPRFPAGLRFQAALKAIDPSHQPGFVSFQAYLSGRLAIAALEKEQGEPERQDYLRTIFSNTFDLGGVTYTFRPGSNQGSTAEFLTIVQPDGTYKLVDDLSLAGNSW
jgi:branched-chain amino acid transport system substrate-binding protein